MGKGFCRGRAEAEGGVLKEPSSDGGVEVIGEDGGDDGGAGSCEKEVEEVTGKEREREGEWDGEFHRA